MTVSQQIPVSNCWGNNSAREFPFNFFIEKESELLVEHTNLNGVKSILENGVDYSIHEVGNKEGSYITFPLANSRYDTLAWDTSSDKKELLTISLNLPIEQSAEFENSGDLSKKNLELSFDYAIRLIQILSRTISRAVKVKEGDEATPDQLIESLNDSKRVATEAANLATSKAEESLNNANTAKEKADIATAKTQEVTETYNNAMADIQKDWQDAIDGIAEKQTQAETSITALKTSAKLTITNGMADITANKEQSMSAIDENRISSIEEISNTKTTAISEVSTAGAEQVSNIKKTGFYMQDDKLYYINADGETKEFISGGGRELLEIYIDPFCDESENKGRIANGQIIIQSQFKDVTKKLKKRVGWDSENKKATLNTSLVCTEEEWQAIKTASKLGQCGKFVIDDEAGTIRLPAIININGLTDLSKAGLIKNESLPNIKGSFRPNGGNGLSVRDTSGAFAPREETSAVVSINGTTGTGNAGASFDASRSSSTYQDNAPVQQETVQYPYVICVNTGVEEAERPINNYQVNNTNSYGDNKYVGDMTLNNLSWLKSEGQTNSGTIYTGFYNWAVANIGQPFGAGYITGPKMYGYSKDTNYHYATINEVPKVGDPVYGAVSGKFIGNIESVDIANASITFHNPLQQNESVIASRDTKYDVTTTNPYFLIVDQANQTFILPTLNGSEVLPSDKYDDLTLGASGEKYIAPANGWYVLDKSSSASGQFSRGVTSTGLKVETGSTFSTQAAGAPIWVKRGDKATITYNLAGTLHSFIFVYAKGNGNLYYYVGDTLQNLDLINIARMQEQKADKSEIDGKWNESQFILAKNLKIASASGYENVKSYDLSSFLPQDNNRYEVLVQGVGITNSVAGNYVDIRTYSVDEINDYSLVFIQTPTNYKLQGTNTTPVIVDPNKVLKIIYRCNNTSTVSVSIKGYRKLGQRA